jgi:hypothetical protein
MNKSISEAVECIIELEVDEVWNSQTGGFHIDDATDSAIQRFKDNFDNDEWIDQEIITDPKEYQQAKGKFITSAIAEFKKTIK